MATMGEISAAINQIDVKKQNLHKSFLHLQSQSPSSFNLPLNWADIDSYFTSLHSSLQSQFNLLQTLCPPSDTTTAPARPELKSFCENSDGLGLNRFIALAADQQSILSELPDAYRCAPDAPAMVLDAMLSFYTPCCNHTELRFFRTACLIMLEGLLHLKPVIPVDLSEKATEMAVEWIQKRVSSPGPVKAKEQKALGFLLLVGAYGLIDRFSIDEIINCFLIVASERHSIDLCRRIVPESNINDMIQKLIDKDMHVTAVNFSIELKKTDEFSPVGLLEERKLMSMRVIEETHRNVKDLHICNAVTMKEISTLKSIIECIEENHLQSEYSKDSVVELVNKLENELENSKQSLVSDLGVRKQPPRASVLNTNDLGLRQPPPRASVVKTRDVNHLGSRKQPPRASVLKTWHINHLGLRKQPPRASVLNTQSVNHLGSRKQPPRASVLKTQLPSKSKKPKLNKVEPTAEHAAGIPVQNVKSIQESHSQKSDLSPDHVSECHNSPLGSDPPGSNAPYATPIARAYQSTQTDNDYSFYVPQLNPPDDCNTNGWISD